MESKKFLKRTNKIKLKQTHRYRDQIIGYQRGWDLARWAKRMKGVNCVMMDGNRLCDTYRLMLLLLLLSRFSCVRLYATP